MARRWFGGRRAVMAAVVCATMLGGCELAGLLGEGEEPALHNIDKGAKVLVLVDVRDGVGVPPPFPTAVADTIGIELWKNKAVDVPVVPQEALIKLQQANPEAYKKMGVADIAQATGADQVLLVYVTRLDTPRTEDGLVGGGSATAYVKIIDKGGQRVWPGDATGQEVTAKVNEGLLSDKGVDRVQKDIGAQLAARTERMFHSYSNESHKMEK